MRNWKRNTKLPLLKTKDMEQGRKKIEIKFKLNRQCKMTREDARKGRKK